MIVRRRGWRLATEAPAGARRRNLTGLHPPSLRRVQRHVLDRCEPVALEERAHIDVDSLARNNCFLVGERIDNDAGGLRERLDEVSFLAHEHEVHVRTRLGWRRQRLECLTSGPCRVQTGGKHRHDPLGLERIECPKRFVRGVVARLTRRHEAATGDARPWKMTDSEAAYIDDMLTRIVGIEVAIARIVGKWKLSQNKDERDRAGAADALAAHGDAALARAMRDTFGGGR